MADTKDIVKATTEEGGAKVEEESTKQKNWADIADEDEDDDQEIGAAGDGTEKPKKKQSQAQPKEEKPVVEEKKDFGPPDQRSKTERGDYVVKKFVIPDRVISRKEGKVCIAIPLHTIKCSGVIMIGVFVYCVGCKEKSFV